MREAILLDSDHIFIPTGEPIESGIVPNVDYLDTNQLAAFVRETWARSSEAHRAEVGRMRMCDLLYNGFHYRDPQLNRELEITNFAFSTVETVWPALMENMPFPVPVPRYANAASPDDADEVAHVAHWLQDRSNVRRVYRRNGRTKLKFGHSIHVVTVDHKTGMPYVIDWSPYDCIFDPSATKSETMEHVILAAPVPTRRLQAMYPHLKIKRDNFASPSFESTRLPYYQHYAPLATARRTPDIYGTHAYKDGDPTPAGGSTFSLAPPNGTRHTGSPTTFYIQLFVRDYTTMPAYVPGYIMRRPGPGEMNPEIIPNQYYQIEVPTCPTGWRFMACTSEGLMPENAPVDRCFDGLPMVVDYDYECEGRMPGIGEIEQIAPLNRAYNERKNFLNRALRLSANPVFVASKGSGINFDKRGIEAGDVLQPTRGSELRWLEYTGPNQQQFEHLNITRADVDTVGGVHDTMMGQRPAGIEAASAINQLETAALRRVRGKEAAHLDAWGQVMTKMLLTAAYKLKAGLYFMGADGEPRMLNPEKLRMGWDVTFAKGSLLQATKEQNQQKLLVAADRGLVPPDELLKGLEVPNYPRINQALASSMAQAAAGGVPSGGGGAAQPA